MSKKMGRQLVAGASAVAMAAGLALTMGAGAASGAPDSVKWGHGNTRFTRTVDNTNPGVYEMVKVSVKFERAEIPVEYVQEVKDLHDPCLTYVVGSARVNGNTANVVEVTPDYVKVKGDWPVYPNINPKSQTFEFRYEVNPSCARDVELRPSSTHYSGSLGAGNYDNKGPFFTVKSGGPTGPIIPGLPNPGGPGGLGSLGPLGSMFGSLGGGS